jgi:hypothetical protein
MKNILNGFIGGNDAVLTESQTDQCLLDIIYEMLSKVFTKVAIPKPKVIIRTKWFSDEFTKGSYSSIRMGSSTSDIRAMAETLVILNSENICFHKFI